MREWIANVYFYKKGDTVIMIDAGYGIYGNPESEVREEERGEIHSAERSSLYLGTKNGEEPERLCPAFH